MQAPRHTSTSVPHAPNGIADPFTGPNAISLYHGEKRESIVDLQMNTPNGVFGLTRYYRQFQQNTARFMGAGWSHSHYSRLRNHGGGGAFFIMPDGGEIAFYGTAHDGQFYRAFPGISAEMFWYYQPEVPERHFEITFIDGTRYWFGGPNNFLTRIIFPNGRYWIYTYQTNASAHDAGLLRQVNDDFGNVLHFRYYNTQGTADAYKHRQLWRVGDHTVANINSTTPSGRFVEYNYEQSSAGNIALLAEVLDVMGAKWRYNYESARAWKDNTFLCPISSYVSPRVSAPATAYSLERIVLKRLSYSWYADNANNGVKEIIQSLGQDGPNGSSAPYLLVEDYDFFHNSSSPRTEVTVAGKKTTHRFDEQVYKETEDPEGDITQQQLDSNYQITQITNAEGEQTNLSWTSSGMFLQQAVDPENHITRFQYENDDSVNGRLLETEDAIGRITRYTYQDNDARRQPSTIRVLRNNNYIKETHFLYNAMGHKLREFEVNPQDSPVPWKSDPALYETVNMLARIRYSYVSTTTDKNYGMLSAVEVRNVGTDPEHQTTSYFYDNLGRVTRTQESSLLGSCKLSHTFYDAAGNVTATVCGTAALPATYSLETLYDPTDPNKYRVTIFEYDRMGRRIKERTNVGSPEEQAKYTYHDSLSRVRYTVTNVQPLTTTWETVGTWVWDYSIRRLKVHGTNTPISHGPRNDQNLVEYFEYNPLGKVRLKRDPMGQTTLYGYSDKGNLTRVIENASNPTYFDNETNVGYGINAGQYVSSTDPDQDIETVYVYNKKGSIVEVKRFRAGDTPNFETTTAYIIDKLGRVRRENINPSQDEAVRGKPDHYILSDRVFDAVGRVVRTRQMVDYYGWLPTDQRSQMRPTLYGYSLTDTLVRTIASASDPDYVTEAGTPTDRVLASYPTGTNPPSSASDLDVIVDTAYDGMKRKIRETDALGQSTYYRYDGLGRIMRTIKNAVGTALDMGVNDPRSDSYVPSSAPDQDLITNTSYNTDGKVQRVQEIRNPSAPNDHWTLYQYDSMGRVNREIRNATKAAYYTNTPGWSNLSGYGTLSTESDRDLATTTQYDILGRPWILTDEKTGNVTYTVYDRLSRAVTVIRNYVPDMTDPANWVWDAGQNRWENASGTAISHGASNDQNLISTTAYDLMGRVVATRDSDGAETRMVYDRRGRVVQTIENYVNGVYDPAKPDEDRITTNTYHKAGYLLTTTDPRGTVTQREYDRVGRVVKVTTAAGTPLATTTYTCYDKTGNVLRVIRNYKPIVGQDPDVRTAATTWQFNPTTHGADNDENLITEYRYDKLGRQVMVIDPLGNTTQTKYDKGGEVVERVDALGNPTLMFYDRMRRLIKVIQGYLPQPVYTDPNGRSNAPDTWHWDEATGRWEDGRGDIIGHGTDNARNLIVTMAYDKAGRMLTRREPRGNLTSYAYDRLDRRTSLTNPLGYVWNNNYTYEANGRTRVHDVYPGVNGGTNIYAIWRDYDRAGRMISILHGDLANTPDITLAYNVAGQRTLMTESGTGGTVVRRTEYSYDKARRLTQARFDVDGNGSYDQTVQYQYDAGGLRTKITLPHDNNRYVNYYYDAKARLTGISFMNGEVDGVPVNGGVNLGYTGSDQLKLMSRVWAGGAFDLNTLDTLHTYDAAGRLKQIRHSTTFPAATLAQFDYTVNALGNRTQALEQWRPNATDPMVLRTISYAYDSASRLTSATYYPNLTGTGSPLHTYGYTYDRSGNRLTETLNATTRTFGYNAANQLVTQGSTTLTYDRNGNLLNDGTNAYTWDRRNRLRAMGGVGYAYDGDGNRVSRTVGGATSRYTLDVQSPLTTVLAEGTTTRYIHGPTGVLMQQPFPVNVDGIITEQTGQWLLQDGLGSVRAVADNLSVLSAQAYSPYGEPLMPAIPSGFGFTGEQTDPSNALVYLRARHLNPRLGIFGSLDPFEGNQRRPGSLNRYGWVQGNVVNRVDPTGLFPFNLSGLIQLGTQVVGLINAFSEQIQQATAQPAQPSDSGNQVPEPITVLLGGSYGDTRFQGPEPEYQTPIWFANSNIDIQYRGVPVEQDADYYTYTPNVGAWHAWGNWARRSDGPFLRTLTYEFEGEILGGKRLQAYQGERAIQLQNDWLNRDIVLIGYSAGADTTLVFLDESVPRLREAGWTGNVSHIVLLGGTFSAGLSNGRQMEAEWQTMLNNTLLSGTNVYVWDDNAQETVNIAQYQPPMGALGNYTYASDPLMEHWLDNSTLGTNNNPMLFENIQSWIDETR